MVRFIRLIALLGFLIIHDQAIAAGPSFLDRVKNKIERTVDKAKDKAREVKREIVEWYANFRGQKQDQKESTAQNQPAEQNQPSGSSQVTAPKLPALPAEPLVEAPPELTAKDIRAINQSVKGSAPVTVAKPAREGDKNLARNKVGVVSLPKFVKSVPRLDIGEEETLSYNDLIGNRINVKPIVVKPFAKKPSPALTAQKEVDGSLPQKIIPVVDATKNMESIKSQDFPVTREKIEAVTFVTQETKPVEEKPVHPLFHNESLVLAALIMNENGKSCHNVVGILRDAKADHAHYAEAKYLSAKCLGEMGLYTQKVSDLRDLLKLTDKEFGSLAIGVLGRDARFAFENDVAAMLKEGVLKFGISSADKDAVSFTLAKVYARDGQYGAAIKEASQVSSKSDYYSRALFIIMMSQYLQGETKQSLETGKQLSAYLLKAGDPHKLETLVYMNMGRIYANNKNYEESAKHYLKVKKDHPQWVQALLEQGWVQLNSADYAGAIGNMFSIQTGFFKNVYKPESYAVRTIGYLNICQYGDAHRTIELFEKIHRPWYARVDDYISKNPSPKAYYDSLRKHLQSPQQPLVDGLPYQVVREMGRHKDFLNVQAGINELVDEVDQWGFLESFFGKDASRLTGKLNQINLEIRNNQSKIAKLQTNKTQVDEVNALKKEIREQQLRASSVEFKIALVKKAQENYRAARKEGLKVIAARKEGLKKDAEKILVKRLKGIREELKQLFANNELLRFEVYSGSGENIRFQVAGGQKGDVRSPDNVKDNNKNLKWEYDGEIWEDEIGNFRSSLQNNCPKDKKSASLK